MPSGVNIILGTGNRLNTGDFATAFTTFATSQIIGTGTVNYTSTNGNGSLSGTYYIGTDNQVHFVPDTPFPGGLQSVTVVTAPDVGVYFGTQGNDAAINGSGGADYILANRGNDTVFGGDGNDTILGMGGNDRISGGAGRDYLNGGGGDDSISGGAGDDSIDGGIGDDSIDGGTGNDRVDGGAGNDSIILGDGRNTGFGGTGDDSITAGSGTDTIYGGAGRDSISAGGGADTIFGGDSADTIDAGAGNDIVYGGAGNDSILGGDGNDLLYGDDTAPATVTTETLSWINQAASDSNVRDGFVQDTGSINVSVSFRDDGSTTSTLTSNTATYVNNDVAFNPNSSVQLLGTVGATTTMVMDFAADPASGVLDAVGNVGFFLTDIDSVTGDGVNNFTDQFIIFAYGPDGNLVPVNITAYGDDTVTSTGTGAGQNTITAGNSNNQPNQPAGSAYVSIVGPVTSIVVQFVNANGGTTNHGVNISDVRFTTILPTPGDDTIDGGAGDDTIYGGGGNDFLVGGDGTDIIYGGDGDDVLDDVPGGPNGTSADTFFGGAGNDTLWMGGGNDVAYGGTGDDAISGQEDDDTLYGDDGNDQVSGDGGNDTLWGGNGNDALSGGEGNDTLNGEAGDDVLYGGAGDDALNGGTGTDSIFGDTGSDMFSITDDNGTNTVFGGEDAGNTDIDTLALSNVGTTQGVTVTYAAPEAGSVTFNGSTATVAFSQIERLVTTAYADTIDASAATGGVWIDAGGGNDTVISSNGDDVIDLGGGAPDGASDLLILQNDFGNDVIYNLDAPIPNGDGTFTAIDTLDVSALTDLTGEPVNTRDVAVSDDGSGNAILTFPNGESLTLMGIAPAAASDEFFLFALGIPMSDGTVNGTTGDDLLDVGYVDDDGDIIDGNDSILPGFVDNDDLILAGDGNDTVYAGDGADQVAGGQGTDTIYGGDGNDFISGGSNQDYDVYLDGDAIYGGAGDDMIETANMATAGSTVFGGDGADFMIDLGDVGSDDTFYGGDGMDDIIAGFGNDTIYGGTGDDYAVGGDGDDTFVINDNENNDIVYGGEGGETTGDVLDASAMTVDTVLNLTGPEEGFLTDTASTLDGDPLTDNVVAFHEIESFFLGSGNDTVFGGEGDDVVDLGAGDDVFSLFPGFGQDTVTGGEAGETAGDTLDASALTDDVTVMMIGDGAGTLTDGVGTVTFAQMETIVTGSGADSISGSTFDDTIFSGAGDDLVAGGAGADTIFGGAGNDTITFGRGDNVHGDDGLASPDGDDLFILTSDPESGPADITIDGGANGAGGDTLQLGDGADLTTLNITSDVGGSKSGTVQLDDGSLVTFSNIENIICFTPGTMIATPMGSRDIAKLRVGDLVMTRDHGLQPIRWIQSRSVTGTGRFAPVRIRPGVVTGLERDLIVSPQHRMLFQGYRAELLFGETEVLVAAKHLVDGLDVTRQAMEKVTYIHMMFDQHEVVYAEGAATESFHPGSLGMDAIHDGARAELFAIFPELRSDVNLYGDTARRCLKRHEAELLRV